MSAAEAPRPQDGHTLGRTPQAVAMPHADHRQCTFDLAAGEPVPGLRPTSSTRGSCAIARRSGRRVRRRPAADAVVFVEAESNTRTLTIV